MPMVLLAGCVSDEQLESELATKNQKAQMRHERNDYRRESWNEKFRKMGERSDARYDAWFDRVMN